VKKFLFIINPVAGSGKGRQISETIRSSQDSLDFEPTLLFTRRSGDARSMAGEALGQGYDSIIAVGGDGTVNEVAGALVHTPQAMGIIPAGSGNGLAHHFGYRGTIPFLLSSLSGAKAVKMDTLRINGRTGLNVSGFGFDGYVAWLFNQSKRRGLSQYTRIALQEYFRYPLIQFQIEADEHSFRRDAHMLVIANAREFGNRAIIAPGAKTDDGLLDLVMVRKPGILQLPATFYRLFNGTLKDNTNIRTLRCRSFRATSSVPVHLHIDGEAMKPVNSVEVKVEPLSLHILSLSTGIA